MDNTKKTMTFPRSLFLLFLLASAPNAHATRKTFGTTTQSRAAADKFNPEMNKKTAKDERHSVWKSDNQVRVYSLSNRFEWRPTATKQGTGVPIENFRDSGGSWPGTSESQWAQAEVAGLAAHQQYMDANRSAFVPGAAYDHKEIPSTTGAGTCTGLSYPISTFETDHDTYNVRENGSAYFNRSAAALQEDRKRYGRS